MVMSGRISEPSSGYRIAEGAIFFWGLVYRFFPPPRDKRHHLLEIGKENK